MAAGIIRKFVIAIGAVALIIITVFITLIIMSWLHSDNLNAQRLHVLEGDGLLHCNVAQISAWHTEDVNTAGSTHGIGLDLRKTPQPRKLKTA